MPHHMDDRERSRRGVIIAVAACCVCLTAVLLYWRFWGGPYRGVKVLASAERPSCEVIEPPRLEEYLDAGSRSEQGAAWSLAEKNFRRWKRYSQVSWERMRQAAILQAALEPRKTFYRTIVPALLSGQDGTNPVCSPLSAYFALGMLMETDPDTLARFSIWDLLEIWGQSDLDRWPWGIDALWTINYMDSQLTKSSLETSLWLDSDTQLDQEVLDTLSKTYHVDVYQTTGGTGALAAVQAWLDERSDGSLSSLLPEGAGNGSSLVSTVRLNARFRKREGTQISGVFHGAGGDTACSFDQWEADSVCCYREKFRATYMRLELLTSSGKLWFILPEEGVTPEELLSDEDLYEIFTADVADVDEFTPLCRVLAMPSFRAEAAFNARPALESLGITGVWDGPASEYIQALRIEVSPYGCNAPDLGVISFGELLPQWEPITFTLDRPFLYAVTSAEGDILYFGIVNDCISEG